MNRILLISLFLLAISCTTNEKKTQQTTEKVSEPTDKAISTPFDVSFAIEKEDEQHFNLITTVELNDGNFFISPFSQDTTYGKLDISVTDNGNLQQEGQLTEVPLSIEEFDTIIQQNVRFVKATTTYKQQFKTTTDDFEVAGKVWFVCEPECLPYDIGFKISSKSGKVLVEKTQTTMTKKS